jgi:hypothetical protein
MTAALADRARHAARSWRDTAELRVSAAPADVESVTVRYLMYVLMPAWFVPGIAAGIAGLVAVPYAEELWRCARDRRQRGPRSLGVI